MINKLNPYDAKVLPRNRSDNRILKVNLYIYRLPKYLFLRILLTFLPFCQYLGKIASEVFFYKFTHNGEKFHTVGNLY